MGRTPPEV